MKYWKLCPATLTIALSAAAIAQPGGADDKPDPTPADNHRQPYGVTTQPRRGMFKTEQTNPQPPSGPVPPGQPNPMPPGSNQRTDQFLRARLYVQPQGKKEKAAFLGVSGSPVPPVLREQLKLEKGVGLVVDFVDPKSPAEEAGIKQYDVLHKMGDQLLINAHQFATLVRMHKPGDEIELTLIRQGDSKHVKVKLTEKEVVALDDNNPWGIPPGPWQNTAGADVMSYLPIQIGPGGGGGVGGGGFAAGNPNVHVAVRSYGDADMVMRWKDDAGEVTLTTNKDGRRVEAKDKSGKVTFTGPINTPEQMQAVPPDVREKLQKMENTRPNVEGFPYPLKDVQGVLRFENVQSEVRHNEPPASETPAKP